MTLALMLAAILGGGLFPLDLDPMVAPRAASLDPCLDCSWCGEQEAEYLMEKCEEYTEAPGDD